MTHEARSYPRLEPESLVTLSRAPKGYSHPLYIQESTFVMRSGSRPDKFRFDSSRAANISHLTSSWGHNFVAFSSIRLLCKNEWCQWRKVWVFTLKLQTTSDSEAKPICYVSSVRKALDIPCLKVDPKKVPVHPVLGKASKSELAPNLTTNNRLTSCSREQLMTYYPIVYSLARLTRQNI